MGHHGVYEILQMGLSQKSWGNRGKPKNCRWVLSFATEFVYQDLYCNTNDNYDTDPPSPNSPKPVM